MNLNIFREKKKTKRKGDKERSSILLINLIFICLPPLIINQITMFY